MVIAVTVERVEDFSPSVILLLNQRIFGPLDDPL
jgi:hypothetical protein